MLNHWTHALTRVHPERSSDIWSKIGLVGVTWVVEKILKLILQFICCILMFMFVKKNILWKIQTATNKYYFLCPVTVNCIEVSRKYYGKNRSWSSGPPRFVRRRDKTHVPVATMTQQKMLSLSLESIHSHLEARQAIYSWVWWRIDPPWLSRY